MSMNDLMARSASRGASWLIAGNAVFWILAVAVGVWAACR